MALRAVAPPPGPDWGSFRLSANQTTGLTVGSPIQLDTVDAGTLGLSGSAIVLPAGRVFRLTAVLSLNFSANNGSLQTAWFDTATGTALGTRARYLPGTSSTASSNQPVTHAIVDTTAGAVTVELRITAATSPGAVAAAFTFAEVASIA